MIQYFVFIAKLLFVGSCNLYFCRSPWSNKYLPPLEDALYPSSELRKLEVEANDIFAIYRDQ